MHSCSQSCRFALRSPSLRASPRRLRDERDRQFFQSVEGNWAGPGEIVAGKYKGTKFICTFSGTTPSRKLGMTLDGGCRVGVFMQKMTATVEHSGRGRLSRAPSWTAPRARASTSFPAMSSTAARSCSAINRKQLQGVMQARLPDDNTMNVTVSVRVDKTMVPVIGMNLKRVDDTPVGAIAKQ